MHLVRQKALLGRVGLFWVNVQNLHLVGQMALLGRVGLFWVNVQKPASG